MQSHNTGCCHATPDIRIIRMPDGIYITISFISTAILQYFFHFYFIFSYLKCCGSNTDIDFIFIIQLLPVTGQHCGVFTFAAALTAIHPAIVLAIGTPNAP